MIIQNSKQEASLKASGKILHDVIEAVARASLPDVNLLELDELADRIVKSAGATCCFRGYRGFPKNICLSVNDAVVHGIPVDYVLREGDVLGIDMGVRYEDVITDSAVTIGIGKIGRQRETFLKTTQEALTKAVDVTHGGTRVGDIGAVIQEHVESRGYGIVRELTGHGVGKDLHEDPHIPNYGVRGTGHMLTEGQVIAIEPITTFGKRDIYTDEDKWTIRTRDGSLGAQFEHTMIVRRDHAEVVT